MNHLKPYPAYKDSGLPWLGEVPDRWNIMRNKLLFREINNRSTDGTEELLTVSRYTGITKRKDRLSKEGDLLTNASSLEGYKRVVPGDLVMNIMLAWNGSLGVSDFIGITSPAYCVYQAQPGIVPRYFHYLYRTPLLTGIFKTESTGVVDSRLRLYPEVFFRLPSVIPPLPEQTAIVRYLDYMDRRIRRYINAKKKLITLLNEQKQAIIHQAVTRGLDPNVRLKPSGVEWLGDIPEHWEVKSLKWWVKINQDTLPEDTDQDYEFTYYDISTIGTGIIVKQPKSMRFGNAPSRARRVLHQNDTIVSTVRTYLKSVFFISEAIPNIIASTGFAVLTPNLELIPEYFSLLIQNSTFINQVMVNSTGVSYPAIIDTKLASLNITIPPDKLEQQAIIKHINDETKSIMTTIMHAQHEIDLLQEYRTRLIADVVTGKLDVREAAANLPEEVEEELDTFEEAESLNDNGSAVESGEEEFTGATDEN